MAIGREDYQERKEDRISRYEERAAVARGEASARRRRAGDIGGAIPLGQPILVGHHSEKRHRADVEKIETNMRKSVEESEKADYYEGKALAASNSRAISGDNPEAVKLYQDKLVKLEAAQERMKAINKAFAKGNEALKALGLTNEQIEKMKSDMPSYEKKPYPAWALSNNNAEIRRIKEKIEELSRLDGIEEEVVKFQGGELRFNTEINRVQFVFDSIPPEEVRTLLKNNGYKWARSEGAWQRQRTLSGIGNAKRIIREIKIFMDRKQND
jgi:hypothetical protein